MLSAIQFAKRCLQQDGTTLLAQHNQYATLVFGIWLENFQSDPHVIFSAYARALAVFPGCREYVKNREMVY